MHQMFVLGINPTYGFRGQFQFWGRHDGGACLLNDDEIIAVVEEERFVREKQALDTFPKQSIRFVLDEAGIGLNDVDVVAIGRNPVKYRHNLIKKPSPESVPTSLMDVYRLFENVGKVAAAYRDRHVDTVDAELQEMFDEPFDGTYHSFSHHRCHAASGAYCAPMEQPVTLTVDATGEHDSTVLWDSQLERIAEHSKSNSLGYLYTYGTLYLGYRHGRDAGKVMGLAPYGEYREDFEEAFDELVSIDDGRYDVTAVTDASNPVNVLEDHFGERRTYPDQFTQRHKDFAFHLQRKTEEVLRALVTDLVQRTGVSDIALAGGVGMNCKANRAILDTECVDNLFIQPAANDSGICLGAALEGYRQATGERPSIDFEDVYHGPQYTDKAIEAALNEAKLDYEREDSICERTAKLLADGALVGWFQGRLEYGARALGNRSILADSRNESSLNLVNRNVKHREPWRPFAPSILSEDKDEYLVNGTESPFMILLDEVKPEKQDEIPAVVHEDGTTRPQTVTKETNERYHNLLSAFKELTGVPILLNTSFNVAGEPIVESPEQAIQDFYSTGLDALVLGDYLVTKPSVDT